MSTYLTLKMLHILSATLMVGTGFGTAFYLFWANRSGSVQAQSVVGYWVAKADWWFTTPAVIFQPISGVWMMHLSSWNFSMAWIYWSIALYVFCGLCWLPVVWLQLRMRDLSLAAVAAGEEEVGEPYRRYQRYWELLGYPAFVAVIIIYALMVYKPM